MKKILFFSLMVLTLFAFLLSACGGDKDNGNPTMPDIDNFAVAEWVVSFMSYSDAKAQQHIVIYWNGDTANLPQNTTAKLEIDGTEITLQSYSFMPGYFWGMVDLNAGTNYNIKFYINNVVKADTSLRMVYQASGNFPNTINPVNSLTINWSLSANNQYQAVTLSSWLDEGHEDEHHKELSPSARSYTFPANAVQGYGSETEYWIGVTQANIKVSSKIAILSMHMLGAEYDKKSEEIDPITALQHTRKIVNTFLTK